MQAAPTGEEGTQGGGTLASSLLQLPQGEEEVQSPSPVHRGTVPGVRIDLQ